MVILTRRNTRLLMLILALALVALVASAVMLHAGHPVLPGHVFADSSVPDVIIHNH